MNDSADQMRTSREKVVFYAELAERGLMHAPKPLGLRRHDGLAPPKACTIYFIGPEAGPIKIGYAARLDIRLRDLRLANAYPLQVWASVEGEPAVEREYHRRFTAHRLHGEWFERHPDILEEIERLKHG